MVIIGVFALWCLKQANGAMLQVVWLFDIALFCFVLAGAIVGCILGLDIQDPVRASTNRAWGEYSWTETGGTDGVLGPRQKNFRKTFWDSTLCTKKLVQVCETQFEVEANAAIGSAHANYTEASMVRDLFADCDYAYRGLQCVTSDSPVDVAACAGFTPGASAQLSCEAVTGGGTMFNGCTYVAADALGVGEACLPKSDCSAAEALKLSCENCNSECKEYAIDKAKCNLLPASYAVYGAFAFAIIAAVINDFLIGMDQMEGLLKSLGLFFNGLVSLTGFGMTIAAGVGQYYLSDECPAGVAVKDCSNPAVMFVGFCGICMLFVGGLGCFTIVKNMQSIGCLALRNTNLVLMCIAFPLLFAGILLSIVSGGLDSINTQADKHFPEMRKSIELKKPDFCSKTDAAGVNVPMTDAECREKITVELEGEVLTVGIIAGATALGLLVVIILTLRSVRALKREGENPDGEYLNPMDDSQDKE